MANRVLYSDRCYAVGPHQSISTAVRLTIKEVDDQQGLSPDQYVTWLNHEDLFDFQIN